MRSSRTMKRKCFSLFPFDAKFKNLYRVNRLTKMLEPTFKSVVVAIKRRVNPFQFSVTFAKRKTQLITN